MANGALDVFNSLNIKVKGKENERNKAASSAAEAVNAGEHEDSNQPAAEEKQNNISAAAGKKVRGRPNVKGINGIDYKKINLAIPYDVYNALAEECHGNLTYHINEILRKHLES